MRRLGKWLFCFTFISFMLLGCSNNTNGTLKVGVRQDIMGLGYYNPNTQEYYGLEIDIARALAKDLNKELELIGVTPLERETLLNSNQVDCIIAAYSIQPSRLQQFTFSSPYYTAYTSVVVEKSSMIFHINELIGKKIGVLSGANAKERLTNKMIELKLIEETDYKATQFIEIDSYDALATALEEGKVDAICLDEEIAKGYMDEDCLILADKIAQEEYGVASTKESELSEQINTAIDAMLEKGLIDELIDKWN